MNQICKGLFISLLITNINLIATTPSPTKNPNQNLCPQQIEVIVPNQKKPSRSVNFIKQILRLAVAAGVVYAVNESNSHNFQQFLEKNKNKTWEFLAPTIEQLIKVVEMGENKLKDENIISKYGIKASAGILAYLATDVTWEDLVDALKTPIYLVNSIKVSAAVAFYYLAYLYYKQYLPEANDLLGVAPSEDTKPESA